MRPVSEILQAYAPISYIPGNDAPVISGMSLDSRTVQAGFLFAAIPGTAGDGASFIEDALAHGAAAVMVQSDANVAPKEGVTWITVDQARKAAAHYAAAVYPRQPEHITAITGTDGKTSTAEFIRQLYELSGQRAASIGTLGLYGADTESGVAIQNTTPGPDILHRTLDWLAEKDIHAVAMEASSHGLDQYRLDGVRLQAGVFTTFGEDHGDYHSSVDAYFEAKARLFSELLPEGARAVLSADDARISGLAELCRSRGLATTGFGRAACDFQLLGVEPLASGMRVELCCKGMAWEGELPLYGGFQALNVLAACAAVDHDIPVAELLPLLPELEGVRGRLERAAMWQDSVPVFVDYAHTAQALGKALEALRPHTERDLWVVFGCGGDRDRGKRPNMGAAAASLADHAIVTDDNPRSEDPAAIRQEILAACPDAKEIGDRTEAIHYAMERVQPGDVLLIAGKGHETTQLVGDKVLYHNDSDVVRSKVMESLGAA